MLRKLKQKDAPAMLEWMKDLQVTQNLQNDFGSFTMAKVQAFIEKYSDQKFGDDNLHYAITDENDEYLGTISLKNVDLKNKNAEYAIVTCQKAHGRGYAATATKEILEIAFYELNLEKVYLYVSVKNIAANKFYQKAGFQKEGVFRKHIFIHGKLEDIVWYSMLKSEFR